MQKLGEFGAAQLAFGRDGRGAQSEFSAYVVVAELSAETVNAKPPTPPALVQEGAAAPLLVSSWPAVPAASMAVVFAADW
jgi:hypothetical protein